MNKISDLINCIKIFKPYELDLKPIIKHNFTYLGLIGLVDTL